MAGCVILGMLAAFGGFCALWAVFGAMLPGLKGCALICYGIPEEQTLWSVGWLRKTGILSCPLLVVSDLEQDCPQGELCAGKDLLARLEMERKRFDGTGNGDHSGHHQRGGIPEL